MFSRFFIDRPIFAAVLSIFIVLAGLAAMRVLPIAQYPQISPPVVTVTAIYPGASAPVLESTVAAPLENAINGVEDMLYMSSTSSANGMVQIQVTFNIGTDIDKAALNVNNRAKQVEPRLPLEVRRQGVTVEKGSSAFLQVLAFYSPDGRYDDIFISNYVTLNVLDELKRIPGTTQVQIFGAKDYAMRIWLRPDRLVTLKLSPGDIIRALNEQNAQFAAGKVGESPAKGQELVYTVTTKGRLSEPREFEEIILRANPDGSVLRLKDVARVELAGKDYSFNGKYNGQPATLMGIFLQPGANQIEVGEAVRTRLIELSGRFPQGVAYAIPFDTTTFVEVSIREVLITLVEAMVLVFLVVFLFLQNWRATIIPFAAVPVSLIGTFAGLLLLGYSINTLTLFGMVLAIGIVVDDAIVVLENVERIMHEEGLEARDAAIKAMKEVTSPIIAIVLVLCAVFIPIAFLGGLTGELYRQFAVTISIAVVLSGFVALTLTPSLCAIVLKRDVKPPAAPFRWFNRGFAAVTDRYENGVAWMIRRGAIALLLFAGMVAMTGYLWRITPGSLVPDEDQGWYFAPVLLPDGASLERTDKVVSEVTQAVRSNPFNEHVMAFTGFDFAGGFVFRENAATIFVTQKHWDQRPMPVGALVGEFFMKTAHIKEGLTFAFPPPAIFGLGTAGGFEFYIQNRGEGGPERLAQVTQQFLAAAAQSPKMAMVNTFWRSSVPQLYVDVDRERAKALGVPLDEIFNTLAATLGTYYVNDFNKYGRTWQVLLSAEPGQRKKPEDAGAMYVRAASGEMVPLRSLAKIEYSKGPGTMTRFNNLPAVQVLGAGKPGISSGDAIAEVERLAKENLPADFSLDWSGASFQEKRSGGTSVFVLALGALMAFLILAAQYEKWSLPLSVMLALPFGTFGALAAVWLRGLTNDVYFQIGLVTLLGLAAKNAILIVEYAVLKHEEGLSASAAAVEAARLRFRPILMTSLAFILGVLPLALSSGGGAGVIGGMLAATFLAIFFVPMFFKLLADRSIREKRSTAEIKQEIAHARGMTHSAVAHPHVAPHRHE
jgi:multidrug efflux pump